MSKQVLVRQGMFCRKCSGARDQSEFRIDYADNIVSRTMTKTHLPCGDSVSVTWAKVKPELWFVKFSCHCFLPVEKHHCPRLCPTHKAPVLEKMNSTFDYDYGRFNSPYTAFEE